MNIGQKVKVYNKVRTSLEICSHGGEHLVPVYSVKVLTITDVILEPIVALHYTHDGYGEVFYAVDAQGRGYRKESHWGGPRATLWVRLDGKTFDQYPSKKFSRDLTNRPIIF